MGDEGLVEGEGEGGVVVDVGVDDGCGWQG